LPGAAVGATHQRHRVRRSVIDGQVYGGHGRDGTADRKATGV
jgi:hypothetical protein